MALPKQAKVDTVKDLQDTGVDIVPVTPSDAANLQYDRGDGAVDKPARALLIETGGALKITTVAGFDRTVTVPAGYLLVRVKKVWSTGTTCTGISAIH